MLPADVPLVRAILIGGGGCGKSTLSSKILLPMLETLYGKSKCVLAAPSNKAARLLKGKTLHNLSALTARDSRQKTSFSKMPPFCITTTCARVDQLPLFPYNRRWPSTQVRRGSQGPIIRIPYFSGWRSPIPKKTQLLTMASIRSNSLLKLCVEVQTLRRPSFLLRLFMSHIQPLESYPTFGVISNLWSHIQPLESYPIS